MKCEKFMLLFIEKSMDIANYCNPLTKSFEKSEGSNSFTVNKLSLNRLFLRWKML